jgi:hypothetical protein
MEEPTVLLILYRVRATETRFKLIIGFINNLQVITTINYSIVAGLHNLQSLHTNLLSLSAVAIQVSLNYTLPISLHNNTHKVLKSHNKSSLAGFSAITHYHIKSSNHTLDPHRLTSSILLYSVRMLLS